MFFLLGRPGLASSSRQHTSTVYQKMRLGPDVVGAIGLTGVQMLSETGQVFWLISIEIARNVYDLIAHDHYLWPRLAMVGAWRRWPWLLSTRYALLPSLADSWGNCFFPPFKKYLLSIYCLLYIHWKVYALKIHLWRKQYSCLHRPYYHGGRDRKIINR